MSNGSPVPVVPASPRDLGLDFPDWRPGQREVVQDIMYWFWRRPEKVLMIEAPTGVGKTLIAAATARMLSAPDEDGDHHNTVVTTISRHLQTQYQETLPDPLGAVAWGRANHQCLVVQDADPSDAPCSYGYRCPVKGECSYYVERDGAQLHDTAVLNTAFYLTGLQYVPVGRELARDSIVHPDYESRRLSAMRGVSHSLHLFEGRSLAIHDEAHLLEGAVRNMMQVSFIRPFYRELGEPVPNSGDYDDWIEWGHRAIEACRPLASAYELEAQRAARAGETVQGMQFEKRAQRAIKNLERAVFQVLPHRPYIDRSDRHRVDLLPIWGAPYAHHLLWNRAHKHLLLSATLPQPAFIARSLGLESGEWLHRSLPSPFHPMNRRVLDVAVQRITHRTTAEQFARLVGQVDDVLDKHSGQRGIIHTVSYQRARQIRELSRHRDRLIIHDQLRGAKEQAIERYLASPNGVLLSPSVAVGEDFGRGDNCRFQVFVKYPIPNLGDPVTAARREEDPNSMWFEADMAFVQSVGRGMRSADDWCVNYLLDSAARSRYGHLPEWFQQSIVRPADPVAAVRGG